MSDRRLSIWIVVLIFTVLAGSLLLSRNLGGEGGASEAIVTQRPSGDWQTRLVKLAAKDSADAEESRPWSFAVARRHSRAMPQQMRLAAVSSIGGYQRLGLQFDRAQYVETTVGVGIWIVRGSLGVTCIFQDRQAAAACGLDTIVAREGLSLVIGQGVIDSQTKLPTRFLVLGIAPDSVRAVRAKLVDGGSKAVPVLRNSYAFRSTTPTESVRLVR